MADFSDPFDFSQFDLNSPLPSDLFGSLLGVDTGTSNASTDVVTVDNINGPSVINNSTNSDVAVAPPDFSITSPANSVTELNDLTQSIVTNPDANDPFTNTFLSGLFSGTIGVTGGGTFNTPNPSGGLSQPSSSSTFRNLLKSLLGGSSAPSNTTGTAKPASSSTAKPTASSTNPILGTHLTGTTTVPTNGVSLESIALWLTIITSIIMIYVFMKSRGRSS